MAYCKDCGTSVVEGVKFCPNCGSRISEGEGPIVDVKQKKRGKKKHPIRNTILILLAAAFLIVVGSEVKGRVQWMMLKWKWEHETSSYEKKDNSAGVRQSTESTSEAESQKQEAKDDKKEQEESDNSDESTSLIDGNGTAQNQNEDADETSRTNETNQNGIDPDLKEFLDSYEAFVDEYVEFMKKYKEDPTNIVSMMDQYTDLLNKEEEFNKMAEKYDADEMTDEEAKYYLEVMTRCTQKMASAY